MLKLRPITSLLLLLTLLAACGPATSPTSDPTPTLITQPTLIPTTPPPFPTSIEPACYRRLSTPLLARAESDEMALLQDSVGFQTGSYRVEYTGDRFLISPEGGDVALALTLPAGDALNMLGDHPAIEQQTTWDGEKIVLTGRSGA